MTDHDPLDDRPTSPIVIAGPDGHPVSVGGATVREQAAEVERLRALWATRRQLGKFVQELDDLIDTLVTNNWAFLDAYSDRSWPGQDVPPADWPAMPGDPDPTTLAQAVLWVKRQMAIVNQRHVILRTQVSFMTYAQTREARLIQLMLSVLAKQIERDPTLAPPPDR